MIDEDNQHYKDFKTFHRANVKALESSEDKVSSAINIQKNLEFEFAIMQYQLEYGIPYPDQTMNIIDQFFNAVDDEKIYEIKIGDDIGDDDDKSEDATKAGQKPFDDRRTKTNTPSKKNFFNCD